MKFLKRNKNISDEEARRQNIEKSISRTLEENFCMRMLNDESYKVIQKVRNKIAQRYNNYEKEIDDLFVYKETIKERVNNEIKINSDLTSKTGEYSRAIKTRKTQKFTNKMTTKNYQIDWLQQIVENENNRANQRLEMVREKTKILKQLMNLEDLNKKDTENLIHHKGVWSLINN